MKSIRPGPVDGVVAAPPSKSVVQRVAAIATLTHGAVEMRARCFCDDALAALRVARALGTRVQAFDGGVILQGGGAPTGGRLLCGEAGTTLRMFTAVAATFDTELILTATGSLQARPVGMLEAPLSALGATCVSSGGRPPLLVRGPMRGARVVVDASETSQHISGLLIALPICDGDSVLELRGLRSKPYVELTLLLLRRFGVRVDAEDGLGRIHIPGGQVYRPTDLVAEGDWSGASFPLVAGALAGHASVTGLDLRSTQADRRILEVLEQVGADLAVSEHAVIVRRAELRPFHFDATHCPDLFPPLVALAAHCEGTSRIHGCSRLRHKESDRAAVLVEQFAQLGVRAEVEDDLMTIHGGPVAGGTIDPHGDHRIAMAAAVVALGAEAPVDVENPGCVAKSYPEFFEDMATLSHEIS
jgi:3-phosphoshikimate 1-carboxyvinyltransferase